MFRFTMPGVPDLDERRSLLREQCEDFLKEDALKEVFAVLGMEWETFLYKQREGIVTVDDPEKKTALYPLLDKLGFFRINRPLYQEYDHILVLGGRVDACFERTAGAREWITESPLSVDALTTPRRIEERERAGARFLCSADTEDEVLREAFCSVFGIGPDEWGDDSRGGCRYRMFSVPLGPDGRRADTGETFLYYLENARPKEGSRILAVTHNRYCNRQFLQLAYHLLEERLDVMLDVAGVVADDRIVPAEKYDPSAFLRDLSGVLYWIRRITGDRAWK